MAGEQALGVLGSEVFLVTCRWGSGILDQGGITERNWCSDWKGTSCQK